MASELGRVRTGSRPSGLAEHSIYPTAPLRYYRDRSLWVLSKNVMKTKFQFRIRSIALIATAIAILCALITHWISLGRAQTRRLDELRKDGINVGYKIPPNSVHRKVAEMLGNDVVASPKELFFNSPHDERIDMNSFLQIKTIDHLVFNTTGIQDEDLKRLEELPNLMHLNLSSTSITDAGIEHLRNLNLISLHVERLAISDNCIEAIAGIRSLKWLSITSGTFSIDALAKLNNSLPGCHINQSP